MSFLGVNSGDSTQSPWYTEERSSQPEKRHLYRGLLEPRSDRICRGHEIEHRLTNPYHPRKNAQAERMIRSVRETTDWTFRYYDLRALLRHVSDYLAVYNFAK